ncbi:MAG: hypothetical protein WCX31_05240 [Salinivirgaceae bacterium]
MDELKNLIEKNRPLFETAEPSLGHFERFEKMLNEQQLINRRNIAWPTILKVACIAVLIVLSGLYLGEHFIISKLPMANQNPEFKEAQQYYIQVVDQRIGEIEQLQNKLSPEQKQLLIKEITDMDDMYKKLQKDYNSMPNDPRIVQAMLQYYQMKADILNRTINDLNKVQQLNYTNHENIEL